MQQAQRPQPAPRALPTLIIPTFVLLLCVTSTAKADEDCAALFAELYAFASTPGGQEIRRVGVKGVRIKQHGAPSIAKTKNQSVVTYFDGAFNEIDAESFRGTFRHLASDRQAAGNQPFDVQNADVLGLTFFRDGNFQFVLKSWDDYTVRFIPSCENGILYGHDPDGLFWAIDFAKLVYPG
jgi:hypothetical protein